MALEKNKNLVVHEKYLREVVISYNLIVLEKVSTDPLTKMSKKICISDHSKTFSFLLADKPHPTPPPIECMFAKNVIFFTVRLFLQKK